MTEAHRSQSIVHSNHLWSYIEHKPDCKTDAYTKSLLIIIHKLWTGTGGDTHTMTFSFFSVYSLAISARKTLNRGHSFVLCTEKKTKQPEKSCVKSLVYSMWRQQNFITLLKTHINMHYVAGGKINFLFWPFGLRRIF